MIAALLALAAHAATPEGVPTSSDPTYARLFGDESAASAPTQEPGPAFPWWTLPAGIGALGLVAASRLRAPGESSSPPPTVRVISRQAVGDKSHLVVVDIPTQAGTRRLLVGTGGGAPSLVADLGPSPELPVADAAFLAGLASVGDRKTSFQDMLEALGGRNLPLERLTRPGIAAEARRIAPDDILETPRATSSGISRTTSAGAPRGTSPGTPRETASRPRGVAAFVSHAEPSPRAERDVAASHARSLVDEVLAERGSEPGTGPGGPDWGGSGDDGRRRSRRTA